VSPEIRAVLFDAGNTLIALDYARLAAGIRAATGRAVAADQLRERAAEAAAWLEQGQGREQERAVAFLESLFLMCGVLPEELPAVRTEVVRLHQERHLWIGVEPGTVEALARLRDAGLRLGVVSNSDGRVAHALEAAGLRAYFDVVVDSTVAGVEKPDPRIFAVALDALGVEPAAAVYVGDVYEVDTVGARRAGMHAVLLDPAAGRPGADVPAIRSLAELPDLLAAGLPAGPFTRS
jgi:putative hydrolase of the HAD superfamily